jgi:hypothetical protein
MKNRYGSLGYLLKVAAAKEMKEMRERLMHSMSWNVLFSSSSVLRLSHHQQSGAHALADEVMAPASPFWIP